VARQAVKELKILSRADQERLRYEARPKAQLDSNTSRRKGVSSFFFERKNEVTPFIP